MATQRMNLPAELFRNIVENLSLEDNDRLTLLDLSKCSKILRLESQRILFRSSSGPFWRFWSSRSIENAVRLHLKFLSAILLDPKRLGPYVIMYRQFGLAYKESDFVGSSSRLSDAQARLRKLQVELWSATEIVFPFMTNLKTLHFSAGPAIGHTCSANILRGCAFQLDTFVFSPGTLDQDELAVYFFPTQRQLRHLTYYGNTKFITRELCPILESLSADESALGALVTFPGMSILEIFPGFLGPRPPEYSHSTHVLEGYKRVRIISVPTYGYLREKTYGGPLGIVLLKLASLSEHDLHWIQNLPELQVLVIESSWHLQHKIGPIFWNHKSLQYIDVETAKRLVYSRCHRPRHPTESIRVERINLEGKMCNWWEGHIWT